jgi:hypothetical protein
MISNPTQPSSEPPLDTRPSSPDPPPSILAPSSQDEALHRLGHRFFSSLALLHGDPKAWRRCQRTDIERNRLLLQREKFQRQTSEIVLRAATDAGLQAIANSPATHAAKLNQVGQILFGNLWKPI